MTISISKLAQHTNCTYRMNQWRTGWLLRWPDWNGGTTAIIRMWRGLRFWKERGRKKPFTFHTLIQQQSTLTQLTFKFLKTWLILTRTRYGMARYRRDLTGVFLGRHVIHQRHLCLHMLTEGLVYYWWIHSIMISQWPVLCCVWCVSFTSGRGFTRYLFLIIQRHYCGRRKTSSWNIILQKLSV